MKTPRRQVGKLSIRLMLPLVVLVVMSGFLLRGLWLDPKKLPSALIGKPIPARELKVLDNQPVSKVEDLRMVRNTEELKGKPWLLNVFASWCQACIQEHPNLLAMARKQQITLVGLAYKDEIPDTQRWLAQHGNPYGEILVDQRGQYGIDLGVYGVPETFLMGADNTILYKHVGPIPPDFYEAIIQPRLEASR